MMALMALIIFVHGLNTYGDDDIHIGPLKFGEMHRHWHRALSARLLQFRPVTNLETRSPLDQAEEIIRNLDDLDPNERLHLLGQSTGGLTARALAVHPRWRERVASVMTVGTPHQGADAALFGLRFAERFPAWHRLFRLFGYDTVRKSTIYSHFTPEAVSEFNRGPNLPGDIRAFSFICELPESELSWPLRLMHGRLNPDRNAGDGFISSQSQTFGEAHGTFALDHFGELGFFPFLSASARLKGSAEFERLADAIAAAVRFAETTRR